MIKDKLMSLNEELIFVQSAINHIDLLKEIMEDRLDAINDKEIQKLLDHDICEIETAINLLNVHLNNAHKLELSMEEGEQ